MIPLTVGLGVTVCIRLRPSTLKPYWKAEAGAYRQRHEDPYGNTA